MSVMQCNFFSKYLGNYVDVTVYIPSLESGYIAAPQVSTDEIYDKNQKFKTIYLLHGMFDDHSAWMRWTMVEEQAQKHKFALVMPSAQNSFYINAVHGLAYYDFINDELPKWAEMNFPLLDGRENRYIAGLSMGGYGALRHALANPDRYSAVGAFSGALDVVNLAKNTAGDPNMNRLVDFDYLVGGADQLEGSDNDLYALAQKCKTSGKEIPKVFLSCGTEDGLYGLTVHYREHLKKIGYDVTYFEMPGLHEWKVWNESIKRFMNMIDPENASE